jgi:hypothetical protein
MLLPTVVEADATLTMKDASGKTNSQFEVKNGMARMSQPGESGYMLYDRQRDVAIHVDPGRKEYTEVDRATLDEYAESVSQMRKEMAPQMAQMMEQLKSLPPEQRAMIEKNMGGMMGMGADNPEPAEPVRTVKRGSKEVAGFDCLEYDVMQGPNKLAEMCVATSADAGLSKDDFATLSAMMKFMRDMASRAQQLASSFGAGSPVVMGDVEGVPVAMKDLKHGHEYSVANVSDTNLDDGLFNEYKSYRKQEMPKMQ